MRLFRELRAAELLVRLDVDGAADSAVPARRPMSPRRCRRRVLGVVSTSEEGSARLLYSSAPPRIARVGGAEMIAFDTRWLISLSRSSTTIFLELTSSLIEATRLGA